jgi:phosphoglycolate phosphatase
MEYCLMYRAVIFDLDGTLLDTLKDIADSVNAELSRRGFPNHDSETYKYFIGDGIDNLVRRALPEAYRQTLNIDELVTLIEAEYAERMDTNTRPYPGIAALLNKLSESDIKMAILTNKPQMATDQAVSTMLSSWDFYPVFGAGDEYPVKPDPTAAREILRSLEISPEECIYLGDSEIDMQTAIAAGLYPVGALWGFRTAGELIGSGARRLVNYPTELLDLLEE